MGSTVLILLVVFDFEGVVDVARLPSFTPSFACEFSVPTRRRRRHHRLRLHDPTPVDDRV
jgi:hypothetical protein